MTENDPLPEASAELRRAAAQLIERAEALEALAAAQAPEPDLPLAPLAPPADPEEAAVRLIALDGAMSGRPRSEVEAELKASHPKVESGELLDRFYSEAARRDAL